MDPVAVSFSFDYMRRPEFSGMRVDGVLRTEPGGLVLEFQERRQMARRNPPPDESIRTLVIPWADVQSVSVRKLWLRRPQLMVRTRSLRALEGLPEARGGEAVLPVARVDHGLAHELAAYVDTALAEHRLRVLDAPGSPGTLPPG